MEYVRRIADTDKSKRRNEIISILDEIGVHHYIQNNKHSDNIVVPFNRGGKKLIICAHYDNIPGSTGANDNASGCSVMLHLIKNLLGDDMIIRMPVDFIFFDNEELGGLGSREYIGTFGTKNIEAVVNLDSVGFGNNLILIDGGYSFPGFYNCMNSSNISKYNVTRISSNYMPFGDNIIFKTFGIPTIGLCTTDDEDIRILKTNNGTNYINNLMKSHIMTTMHHGANDDMKSVSQIAIDMTVGYLYDCLKEVTL